MLAKNGFNALKTEKQMRLKIGEKLRSDSLNSKGSIWVNQLICEIEVWFDV